MPGSWESGMIKRVLFILMLTAAVLGVTGCDNGGQDIPKIVGHIGYRAIEPLNVLFPKETHTRTALPAPRMTKTIPWNWRPPSSSEKSWKAIVIHHSATVHGNAESFGKTHTEVHKWNGIGYDFVIGNGQGSGNGQIEVTHRWRQQITGAHCGGTPRNWANEDGIGICLVGDFTKTAPTTGQLQALTRLVTFLQERYRISTSRIYGHGSTPGYVGGTQCPGHKFPMTMFKRTLYSAL